MRRRVLLARPDRRAGARRFAAAGCRRELRRQGRAARGGDRRRARRLPRVCRRGCGSRGWSTTRSTGAEARRTSCRPATPSTAGTDTRPVLDLLMRLEGEAKKAGGRVHALLGNHEVMNLLGDLRYVRREKYKGGRGASARTGFPRAPLPHARGRRAPGGEGGQAGFRRGYVSCRKFEEDFPFGYVERRAASSRTRGATESGCANARRWCGSAASPSCTAGSRPRWRRSAARRSTRTAGAPRDHRRPGQDAAERPGGVALRRARPGRSGSGAWRARTRGTGCRRSSGCWPGSGARAVVIGHTVTSDGRVARRASAAAW